MINERTAKRYCKDFTKIENYEKAIADTTQTWQCHHRLELEITGGVCDVTAKDLTDWNLYYDRPAEELIFLTHSEHRILHMKGKPSITKGQHRSVETRRRISEAQKGTHRSEETKRKIGKANSKKVLCVETGEVFESIKDTYRKTGMSSGGISAVCNGKRKTTGGYHWRFV